MRLSKIALPVSFLLLALGATACKGGPEGSYALDKEDMKKSMEAEIAKMPEDQQGFGKFALVMIAAMDVKLELKKGGEATMTTTKPTLKEGEAPKTETKTGKWRKEGENVIITSEDGKDMNCAVAEKKLTCTGDKPGKPGMVFQKS
jgi:hypothetical protein